jgi:hypothetical protein
MSTFYNGIEIKSTTAFNGRSLSGRQSFVFNGRTITLSTPLLPVRLSDGRWQSPVDACTIGGMGGGTPMNLYTSNARFGIGDFIFSDIGGNSPFNGFTNWYYHLPSNASFKIDLNGEIISSVRC